jgi:ferritin
MKERRNPMLNERIEKLINTQITKELYSSTLYLSMSAWFANMSLDGFAKWYYVQTQEERDHALIFYHYMKQTGTRTAFQQLDAPTFEFKDILDILEQTVKHEEFITASIYEIVKAAHEENDYKTVQFLNWFIEEQVQEENNANTNLNRFKTMGLDGKAVYLLDQELKARVYAKTPLLVTMEAAA